MDPAPPPPSPARADPSGHAAGAVAHDVNNLLQVILGCCDKLRGSGALPVTLREELDHIAVAAEHATALTAQMRTRPARRSGERRTIALRPALQRLHGLLQRVVGDTIEFALTLPADDAGVRIGEGDLAQVLVNLAVNAREAMPGGGRFAIDVVLTTPNPAGTDDAQSAGRFVRLDVADTGSGMSADVRERAFERFFSTKGADGSGHGLATVHAIVTGHGGTIDVHSEPGRGTHFTILLPMGDAPAAAAPAPVPRAQPGETVLVVDDEPMAREVIVSFLEGLGYQTQDAGSASAALAIVLDPRHRIDAIVADVTMPDMTGIELARRVRAAAVPTDILLVSGDTADAVQGGRDDAAAFLQKPFTVRDLGETLRHLLDRRPASPARPSAAAGPDPAASESPRAAAGGGLIDVLPAPVFIVRDGRFVYVNAALAALLVLPADGLVGHSSLERVHPDDRRIFPSDADVADAARAGRPVITQVRVRCGDGAERSLVITAVPAPVEGTPAILGVASDATVQPDALNVAVRMAALGRLAGGVAHDYNNLLLVMGGHLERLQKKLPPGIDIRPDVDAIAAAATRAGTLTDKLLSFGRVQLLAPEIQDLGALVETVAAELRASVAPAIDLRVERDASVPPIEADRSRLREVLWHLVDNAREAMPDGGTLTLAIDAIEVDAALQARWAFLHRGAVFVRLRVIDTGRGMAPDVAAHAFEPFFTTKGKGRGAGMGLASVYGIVKQSRGYVIAERVGQRGTCMTVLLPPAAARREAATSVEPTIRHTPADPGGVRNRILLVEDDRGVREILEDVLSGHGFAVHAAGTAEEAQAYAASHPVDLLLSDVDLPGMNGARLAAALLASQPGLPVILMSGYPDDGTIDGELAERPMFLSKPFRSPVLLDYIRRALADAGRRTGA